MFEAHFGLSGPPFQLSPDPSFYFDSRGHANALAYLKFGVYQGEGFIVVTGEVGAGKTTLVRALLAALDPSQVVAAQVVSTQLESGDLLRAISAAFGIAPAGRGKADLILSLESFMTALATTDRRALLIVDEAQNLSLEAIEELRMLSNFQLGNRALMQSFLIGQPELRAMLESRSMEQFRQRVIASCHLGPLDPAETRAYIEHRLRHVGWRDFPSFADDAFDELHVVTGGIPRRINQLCNRLLLAAFLAGASAVSRGDVKRVAREMRGEVGEDPAARRAVAREPRSEGAPRLRRAAEAQTASIATDTGVVECVNRSGVDVDRPLLCIAGGPASFAAVGMLSQAIAAFPELPQVVVVNPGEQHAVSLGDAQAADALSAPLEIHLGALGGADASSCLATLAPRFEALLLELAPRALATIDDDEASVVCAMLARAHGVPLVRLEAGRTEGQGAVYGAVCDRLSDLVVAPSDMRADAVRREGVSRERLIVPGSLLGNVLHGLRPLLPPAASVLARHGAARVAPGRFVLVSAQYGAADESASERHELSALVAALARRAPTIWLVGEPCMASLLAHGLYGRVQAEGVVLLPSTSYFDSLALLGGAGCLVFGGDRRLADEAALGGIAGVSLQGAEDVPAAADVAVVRSAEEAIVAVETILGFDAPLGAAIVDDAAGRIAAHLRSWLGAKWQREIPVLTAELAD